MIDLIGRIEQSGFPLKKLAKLSGLTVSRLEELQKGGSPSLGELRKLSAALGMPISDLIAITETEHKAEFLFRQKLPKVKDEESYVISRLSRFIANSFQFLSPEKSEPSWIHNFQVEQVSYQEAERLARDFRDRFYDGDQFGPILTLPKIVMEKLNALLLVIPEQRVDGASAIISGHVFIFISPRFPARMLFTLAHEIGHCIAHHSVDGEYAIFDRANQVANFGRNMKNQEGLVDAFASCLLMPSGGVALALRKIREITITSSAAPISDVHLLYLSRIFGVSFEVAARRCEDLELLPKGGAYSLYRELKEKFGSPEKRGESIGLPPRPNIEFPQVPMKLLTAAIEKIKSGDVSIGRASNCLNLSIADFLKAHAPTT